MMMKHLDELNKINQLLLEDTDAKRIEAANYLLEITETPGQVRDPAQAMRLMYSI